MSRSSFHSLEKLAGKLPFHLDDTSAINQTYLRWHEDRNSDDRRVIQLWTYCYIRRYFLLKFARETWYSPGDLDAIIESAFRKVESREFQIRQPERYASWVSVLCKNTFINYIRGGQRWLSLRDAPLHALATETPMPYNDSRHNRQALLQAIGRLPCYLQKCAMLRFVHGLSYKEISIRTGYETPCVRTFAYKIVQCLSKDEEFLRDFEA